MSLRPLGWLVLDHAALTDADHVHRLGCARLDALALRGAREGAQRRT